MIALHRTRIRAVETRRYGPGDQLAWKWTCTCGRKSRSVWYRRQMANYWARKHVDRWALRDASASVSD